MPIISFIGARSPKVRLTYALMYSILLVGCVTMLYPLSLMLAGAVKSDADFYDNAPYPSYLWDDDLLWTKYLESKYARIDQVEQVHGRTWSTWQNVKPPAAGESELASQFRQFRQSPDWPAQWTALGHVRYQTSLGKNARIYRAQIQHDFKNDLDQFNHACNAMNASWLEVGPPRYDVLTRRFDDGGTPDLAVYRQLKQAAAPADRVISDPDAAFIAIALRPQWSAIDAYNRAHDTTFSGYDNVFLSTAAPTDPRQRADWDAFVRQDLGLSFIKIDRSAAPAFTGFLRARYNGHVEQLNQAWQQQYGRFENIDLPTVVPVDPRARADYVSFIKESCPIDALSVNGPRQAFEQFLGRPANSVRLPIEATDRMDFTEMTAALRWEFLTQNYRFVIDYLFLHSNGIRNTVIYCVLMIVSSLLVNPLAAYALSRYQPPATQAILLFCMATMTFPAEVTMIPSFLLLKRFPLYSLLAGVSAAGLVLWLIGKTPLRRAKVTRGFIAAAAAALAGWWLLPLVASSVLHQADLNVSLLNSFWALVPPNIANGFSIFLLKGFFDSLPQELYEAAELDGATEWHKFWVVTMSLSKPILAVIALGVFTAAYSEFMMALVIIPDQKMWTIMVWLFQLQNIAHPAVIYATLAVAAIPTFSVFLFAQKLILRGIVVPTEK